MKTLRLLLASLILSSVTCLRAGEAMPDPTMPNEVILASGRVLRKVQVVRWEKDRVILRSTSGVDPVAFSLFKVPLPSEIPAMKEAAMRAARLVGAPTNRTIAGQVFVTTRGNGAYKYAGAQVRVFPLAALDAIRSTVEGVISAEKLKLGALAAAEFYPDPIRLRAWESAVENLRAVATTTTDADGLFRITITSKEPLFVYCASHREVGIRDEYHVWAVPIAEADRIDLNSLNHF